MNCWAVIPCKPATEGKSRLADALDMTARETLVRSMLAHVVDVARRAGNISHVFLLGPSRNGLPDDLPLLPDPGQGLNPALHSGLDEAIRQKADRVIFVFGDLPTVTPRELELLAAAPAGEIAIAPDRHETGTNALSLPLPEAAAFAFAFGTDSFAKHRREAERLGLKMEVIFSHGLANDVDEPSDLPDAQTLLKHPD